MFLCGECHGYASQKEISIEFETNKNSLFFIVLLVSRLGYNLHFTAKIWKYTIFPLKLDSTLLQIPHHMHVSVTNRMIQYFPEKCFVPV